jgi:peroxiredoxin
MRPMVGLSLLLIALALMAAGCRKLDLFRRAEPACARANGPSVGTPAPEIDGETFDGQHLKLSDHRGKVVVVVFWYSGCMPCLEMIPHERELAERHRDKPFALLGVNVDVNLNAARKTIASKKMTWPIWQPDAESPIDRVWDVSLLPAIFVIDPDGIVRHANVRGRALDEAVEKLLAETETAKSR